MQRTAINFVGSRARKAGSLTSRLKGSLAAGGSTPHIGSIFCSTMNHREHQELSCGKICDVTVSECVPERKPATSVPQATSQTANLDEIGIDGCTPQYGVLPE